jgi:alpha-L-rhamnosidase
MKMTIIGYIFLIIFVLQLLRYEVAYAQSLLPTSLRVNNLENPLAVLVTSTANVTASPPMFSWSLNNTESTRAIVQESWHLQIFKDDNIVCDENSTTLTASFQAVYACSNELSQLVGGTRLMWRVSVQGSDSSVFSKWSQAAFFGLSPDMDQWNQTPWIATPIDQEKNISRPYRFRTTFSIPTKIQINSATIFVATPAYYTLFSNGSRVTNRFPMSTFTIFSSRVDFDAFDVTSLFTQALADGSNQLAFGVRLGGGPFGTEKFQKVNDAFRLPLRVIIILDSTETNISVLTPIQWKSFPDSILYSDWYAGEAIDNRLETNFKGWDTTTFDDSLWAPSTECDGNCGIENARLIPQLQASVQMMSEGVLSPVSIQALSSQQRSYTISFGQNFAGFIELDIPTPPNSAGTTVYLYAGERIFPDNSVYNQLNSSTHMILNWTLSGLSTYETASNVFSFWGFQHVQVSNWPVGAAPPTLQSVRGIPTSTLERRATIQFDGINPSEQIAASFESEKRRYGYSRSRNTSLLLDTQILAGVAHAAYWSQSSNYQSIPSDCPNREKRGWLGDQASSALQATTVFDASASYYSWTRSHGDDQAMNGHTGVVNNIVPAEVNSAPTLIDAAWGLAVIEVVYQSFTHFFEDRTLKERYKDMKSFVDWLTNKTNATVGIMKDQWEFGDWDAQFPRTQYVPNTGPMGATGSWLRCLRLMEELAPLAGHPEDAAVFRETFINAIKPFNAFYALNLTNGTYGDGEEQTLAIIPLNLGIVPATSIDAVQNWLIHDIETTQALHLTTGSTGTRFFFETLTQMGRVDLAAVIAAQSTMPSHGYWITQGATTCWENWSGEADEPHPPPPTRNHIFLCSQIGWMYESLLGLSSQIPNIIIMPPLIDSLPSMSGAISTPGSRESPASLSWAWTGSPMASKFQLNASVPANMNATISFPVPGLSNPIITESNLVVWQDGAFAPNSLGIFSATQIGGYIQFETGSGDFAFSSERSTSNPVLISSCVSGVSFHNASLNLNLICPSGSISHITRAGILSDSDTAFQFSQPHVHHIADLEKKLSHRFLLTHSIERLCPLRTEKTCRVSISSIREIEGRLFSSLTKEDAQICVVATCN